MEKAFIHGFILAFGLILPLGVQNLFILQQGMAQKSMSRAMPSVIAAACSDTILITLAVSGVSLILMELPFVRTALVLGGSVFLLYMGWTNWHSEGDDVLETEADILSAKKQILFAMSVSFLNPYAFLDTVGVIGTSSLQYDGTEKLVFTLATILVSWIWFTGLSGLGHILDRVPKNYLKPSYIQHFSAVFIWGSACYLMYGLFCGM